MTVGTPPRNRKDPLQLMTDPADGPPDGFVSNYLLYLLAAASDAASAQFHAHVRANGLKVAEWRVLACLIEKDGQMITRLARVALFEQSRLTRIIEKMEDRGLVTRRPDLRDGRRVRVHLTGDGRALADRLVTDAQVHENDLIAAVATDDGTEIKSVLKSLIRHLAPEDGNPQ